jgi:hypothetical protein
MRELLRVGLIGIAEMQKRSQIGEALADKLKRKIGQNEARRRKA